MRQIGIIGITEDQERQIEALHRETEEQRRKLRKRLSELYHQLETAFDTYDFDRKRARAMGSETMELRGRMLALQFENEEKLRRILTREQFDRVRATLREQREHGDHRDGPGPRRDGRDDS